MIRARHIAITAVFLLAILQLGQAQEPFPDVFTDAITVEVVNLEVFVTDKNGKRVTGLDASDFEVLIDGVPVEITNFLAIEDAIPVNLVEKAEAELETGSVEPQGEPEPARRSMEIVVYIENHAIRRRSRAQIIDMLTEFVSQRIEQGDGVMIVSHTGQIQVLTTLTDDVKEVEEALASLGSDAAMGDSMDGDWAAAVRGGGGHMSTYRSIEAISHRAFAHFAMLVSALAGREGRKAVFYVSDGLLMTNRHDPKYKALTNAANAGGVTIYTVDAGGLTDDVGGHNVSAEQFGYSFGGRILTSYSNQEFLLTQLLLEMAEETGGALVHTPNLKTLTKVAEDFESWYSLGILPPEGEHEDHKVEVRVRRKGLHVRHRDTFRIGSENERLLDQARSALVFRPLKNPLGIKLKVGDEGTWEKETLHLPLVIRIPVENLAVVPQGKNLLKGQLRLLLISQDQIEGEVSPVRDLTLPFNVAPEQLVQNLLNNLAFKAEIPLTIGAHRVAVTAVDALSPALASSATVDLVIDESGVVQ